MRETAHTGTVVVNYIVRDHGDRIQFGANWRYDWATENTQSEMYFESIEDAVADAENFFS